MEKMNEILQNMVSRRSVKNYKPDMVPEDVIRRICEAGTYAASGMGRQAAIILAITNRELRDKLSEMNAAVMGRKDFDPFYGAPVVLVVLADKNIGTHVYDGSLVMGNLMLAAHAEGVGSCWIHRAKEEFESEEGRQILKSLGIEGDYEGIGHCVLGYPEGEVPEAKERKPDYVRFVR
ncbi:MAG: nitroreductase [Muribaculum sp.]|nr:nitroreductase [Muribaculum sp.]